VDLWKKEKGRRERWGGNEWGQIKYEIMKKGIHVWRDTTKKSENKECQIITRNSKWYDSCSTIFEGNEKREQEKE